jgi:hypothetical protein
MILKQGGCGRYTTACTAEKLTYKHEGKEPCQILGVREEIIFTCFINLHAHSVFASKADGCFNFSCTSFVHYMYFIVTRFTGCKYVDLTPPAQIWVDWRAVMQTKINLQFP